MKKIIFTFLIVIAGFGFSGCTSDDTTQDAALTQNNVEELPDRPSEVNGVVRSIEGNELIIANEIKDKNLTEEEKDAQKEERQNLTQEERQALRQEELKGVETETLTLIIPVGVPILKASGTSDGSSVNADLAEIKSGSYVSIWINNDEVEAVKLKGIN